ncbi:MAG: FAD/NAD(P)-binding protein [Elusimicrobia bacterium]|nr:FAD/NAD(P)-binding protein [Elusimicrobiota bacterium]
MPATPRVCACGKKAADVKPNIFLPREAEIVRVEKTTELERVFTLRLADGGRMEFAPGQIVEAGLFGYGEIPLGLASSPTRKNTFDLVVRSVGRVSSALNRLEAGQSLQLRGPLGRGFPLEELRGHDLLVVAGGIGLCPTRSLIQYVLDRRQEFKRFTLFYGARDPKQQLFTSELADWRKSKDVEYHETVDKGAAGWTGNVGVITALFSKTRIDPGAKIVICGPPIMFKFVVRELDKLGVPHRNVYLDLERRMKCGVGKCGHCQINDKYVCVDGPVFALSEIEHLEEAL